MFKAVVGHSNDPDSLSAVEEVIQQCITSLADDIPQAGILFAAIDFEHSLILQQIHQAFSGIELIGGTTDGEISSVLEFQQDSITLMLFCSDEVEIYAGVGRQISADTITATKQAVEQAKAKTTAAPSLCLTHPESLTTSGVSILNGLKLALGQDVPIFGGLAADHSKYQNTYQFFQTEVLSDSVPILLFCGKILFSHGVASGWRPIGQISKVTKVDKNILYEIDGKPALDFYHHYLGLLPPSMEYPLAVFEEDTENFYIRAPIAYEPESGSITFFADIPDQALIQISEAGYEDILAASKASFMNALNNYPGKEPSAVLFFSCVARRQILGTRAQEEYENTKVCLDNYLPTCGFYSNGEIAPIDLISQTQFHNETFVTLILGVQ
ncbi:MULTISPECIES: FIST signal transduction protein [Nostoc]|uniref:FIST C-terminal domain-containing protein n=1 Tax=Nostoc paludosum FACHB-159 TaxID=2692908 RepID=A0ABR8K1G8_9NOSO|nr:MULTISPECIES: FIST N-terminal domain-containing protein [Nostoc]MBD2677065.1 FIST C-terminal domain-containing protein [Nostoc sp. FACHB-857]MBD2733265.1 FIST C-terminal domain-containing protein [Nostoc paludosum FACHB-159]